MGLSESARRHGVNIFIDARVTSIDHSTSPVKVTTEKGDVYKFDLLIGSDGLKSVVRKVLFPEVRPRAPTKNAAYRAIIPYKEVFAKVPEAKGILGNNIDVWLSEGGYCIGYPISAGKDFNIVLAHHRDNLVEDVEEVKIEELRHFYKDYDPLIKKIIDMVPSSNRWPLLVTGPLKTWSNDTKNVVLMGDAAHSMVNHLATGAATSIEDGCFLGRVISEVVRGVISIPEAISIYETKRMPRAWIKQQASFTAGQTYQMAPSQSKARDLSSAVEVASMEENVTNQAHPSPTYRGWNLWGYPDTVPGIYTYDAEGDADNAVCEYLQSLGDMDSTTKVTRRLREKWQSWFLSDGRREQGSKL